MEANRAEIYQKDSSERYKKLFATLLDGIPSSILLIDRHLRIVSANLNFLEKSRRSLSNTLGYRLREVFPSVVLEYKDLVKSIRQVFEKSQSTQGERITYCAQGVPMRIYSYSILPFFWNGVVEHTILLMEDITEQVHLSEEVRRIERHLASIVESANDIILSTDIEGRILTWNTAAEKLSGYTFHEVKGRSFFEYFAKERQQEVILFLSRLKATENREISRVIEWDLVTRKGALIPISWVFSMMKDELTQTVGMVGVGRDLTERRKFEMQLFRSQKLAALGVMAGGIAHEIRNPLAVCSSAAQFLMEDHLTPEFQRECAQKIQTGIQKATIIIENLLKFGRPLSQSDITEVHLISVLKETLTLIKNQAKLQKIQITTHFSKGSIRINGNANLLQQVFMNLFLNAIHAMPKGGRLSISTEKMGGEVKVRIKDTGRGISKMAIENIFDPFYTTSAVGKGTGLGLSICYSIIKHHLGSIDVESKEGKGSTFTVRFPILRTKDWQEK